MNKLLLKPQIWIEEDGSYCLECTDSEIEIFVLANVHCDLLLTGEELNSTVTIHVLENAKVYYQSFFKNVSSNVSIFLEEFGAEIEFIHSMMATRVCGLKIQVSHMAKHTVSTFYNSIVNYGNDLVSIQVDASVFKNQVGCHLNQDNKIILVGDGKGKILPNLWIDEFDCFAEHSAYISQFPKDEMFYLQMRGISKEKAYFLLSQSLLLGKLKLPEELRSNFIEMVQRMGGE